MGPLLLLFSSPFQLPLLPLRLRLHLLLLRYQFQAPELQQEHSRLL